VAVAMFCSADLLQELCWCQHSAYAQVLPAQPKGRLDEPLIGLGLQLQERQHTSNMPCKRSLRPCISSSIAGMCACPMIASAAAVSAISATALVA
jgi:hypothetical protein